LFIVVFAVFFVFLYSDAQTFRWMNAFGV